MWIERWKTRADFCDHYKQINRQWANFGHKKTHVYIRVAVFEIENQTTFPSIILFVSYRATQPDYELCSRDGGSVTKCV